MALEVHRREQMLSDLARRLEEMEMIAPAILFLETYKPLAFLGAQFLWFAQPFLGLGFKTADLRDLTLLLEDRASVEELIARLEASQSEKT